MIVLVTRSLGKFLCLFVCLFICLFHLCLSVCFSYCIIFCFFLPFFSIFRIHCHIHTFFFDQHLFFVVFHTVCVYSTHVVHFFGLKKTPDSERIHHAHTLPLSHPLRFVFVFSSAVERILLQRHPICARRTLTRRPLRSSRQQPAQSAE